MSWAGRSEVGMGLGASVRDQDERVTAQDLVSFMDTLLFPPGGAGHHKAVTD